jgi:selenocysteine lyase/cysteine desulfurase
MTDPAPLPDQRHLYEPADEVAYFNTASMSALLTAARAAGERALALRATPWRIGADDWFAGAEVLRGLAGGLMGSDAEGVAIVPSSSYGMAVAAANLALGPGRDVVLLDGEFPSNLNTWTTGARRAGARAVIVGRPEDGGWTEAILAAIGETTAVVSVPNCHWTDGALVDLVRVGQAARDAGAALVVDASQSFAAYPLDVAEVRPDFLVSVGYKWQHGPYALSYLYASERWRDEGRPIEQTWLARAGAEDFAALTTPADAYRPGARRFDMGHFPQMSTMPMAIAGLEQITAWGVDRIQVTLSAVTARIEAAARNGGWSVEPEGHRVGHFLGVGGEPDRITALNAALRAENILAAPRGASLRIAPHLHNSAEDVERLCAVLTGEA